MELIRQAPARDRLKAAALRLAPVAVLRPRQPRNPQCLTKREPSPLLDLPSAPTQPLPLQQGQRVVTRKPSLPQIEASATPLFPAPSLHSLEMYPSTAGHCDSLQGSFSKPSDPSTLADQPTIMLRSLSQPSTKTRIACGTTDKTNSHISQKCQTRALSYPPKTAP